MTTPFDKAKSAILGVPVDPNKQPSRTGLVQAFAEMQTQLEGAQSGAIVKATKSALDAMTSAPSVACMAWVTNDSTLANNGIYENTGTVSAPIWARRTDIPQFFISAINVGAGTANAIQVTTDLPIPAIDGRCLIALPIVATNTSSSVTVAINGGTPLTVVRNYGTPLTVGDLVSGVFYLGVISDNKFKLINPARDVIETVPPDGTVTAGKLAPRAASVNLGDSLFNVSAGPSSFTANTTGYTNVAIGNESMKFNTTGHLNLAIGSATLRQNTSGFFNAAVGPEAMLNCTTGDHNVGVGIKALFALTIGQSNVAVGANALGDAQGSYNIGIGPGAHRNNTTGTQNVSIGMNGLYNNTSGSYNISIGPNALQNNAAGNESIAIGLNALLNSTSGVGHVAIGSNSQYMLNGGQFNVSLGTGTLRENVTGVLNTIIGHNAGYRLIGSNNTAVGGSAGSNLYGGTGCTLIGRDAGIDVGRSITATAVVSGFNYIIHTIGTTDWTAIGAASNTAGITFNATGTGTGTGTCSPMNPNNNTIVGSGAGGGIVMGWNNTILGANVTGLPASTNDCVIIATGQGIVRADYNRTLSGAWNFAATVVKSTATTFSALPSAATAGTGARAFITDCNTTTFAAVAAAGGANKVPVYSDGTAWRVG